MRTSFEWFHKWVKAPKEVAFLRNEHRHLFGVVVEIEVTKNDRELEYFVVLKDIKMIITNYVQVPKNKKASCETMAEIILDLLETKYTGRRISVEVNEDGENGSVVDNYDNF